VEIEREVLIGHPVDILVGAVAASHVGLVVVSARGLGTLERVKNHRRDPGGPPGDHCISRRS
jgi:hypothetical protein